MSDLNERTLERAAATGCADSAAALARARERRGDRLCDHPLRWWDALTVLEALRAGYEPALVRQRYGIQRLPRGSREATAQGERRRARALLERARKVPLSHSTWASLAGLRGQLAEANGRRRERVIGLDELLADIGLAAERPELDAVTGSYEVARAYRYPARTTATTCVRIGQRVCVWVSEEDAGRGTRHTPWQGGGGRNEGTRICAAALGGEPTVISRAAARKLGGRAGLPAAVAAEIDLILGIAQ